MRGVRKGRRVNPLIGINPLSAGCDSLDPPGKSVQGPLLAGKTGDVTSRVIAYQVYGMNEEHRYGGFSSSCGSRRMDNETACSSFD
jgi:hypothetical protein